MVLGSKSRIQPDAPEATPRRRGAETSGRRAADVTGSPGEDAAASRDPSGLSRQAPHSSSRPQPDDPEATPRRRGPKISGCHAADLGKDAASHDPPELSQQPPLSNSRPQPDDPEATPRRREPEISGCHAADLGEDAFASDNPLSRQAPPTNSRPQPDDPETPRRRGPEISGCYAADLGEDAFSSDNPLSRQAQPSNSRPQPETTGESACVWERYRLGSHQLAEVVTSAAARRLDSERAAHVWKLPRSVTDRLAKAPRGSDPCGFRRWCGRGFGGELETRPRKACARRVPLHAGCTGHATSSKIPLCGAAGGAPPQGASAKRAGLKQHGVRSRKHDDVSLIFAGPWLAAPLRLLAVPWAGCVWCSLHGRSQAAAQKAVTAIVGVLLAAPDYTLPLAAVSKVLRWKAAWWRDLGSLYSFVRRTGRDIFTYRHAEVGLIRAPP
ncbi:hypothetical protein DIPPA_26904 [Diplonema papillatum]|nr:hypothetical protein DIPPA_26904 [Diplonema papillatum]